MKSFRPKPPPSQFIFFLFWIVLILHLLEVVVIPLLPFQSQTKKEGLENQCWQSMKISRDLRLLWWLVFRSAWQFDLEIRFTHLLVEDRPFYLLSWEIKQMLLISNSWLVCMTKLTNRWIMWTNQLPFWQSVDRNLDRVPERPERDGYIRREAKANENLHLLSTQETTNTYYQLSTCLLTNHRK